MPQAMSRATFRLWVSSIQHAPIVRTRRQEVIHHPRDGGRIVRTGDIALDPFGIVAALAEFYRD